MMNCLSSPVILLMWANQQFVCSAFSSTLPLSGRPLKCIYADFLSWIFLIANLRASEFPREYDGGCLQMRMSYSPAAHLFLFLVQWTDCSLAGALGLLRILIYKVNALPCYPTRSIIFYLLILFLFTKNSFDTQVYADGTTTMSTHERKASIREFYGKYIDVANLVL